MNHEPKLPEELVAHWKALLASDRAAGEDFYFDQILTPLLAVLQQRPEHAALRAEQFQLLVSLMGFSPETTVVSAAILRPQKLVIVLSERAERSYDRAHDYLTAHKILRPSQIERLTIPPTDPRAIYNELRRVLAQSDGKGEHNKRIFDVTGGKKIMSATAGQVAWEADWPLCYIDDQGNYDATLRRPLPGSETVIVLPSPSQRHVQQARRAAIEKYDARNYASAIEAFQKSAAIRAENRLEHVAIQLCECYRAWSDLDLPRLGQALERLRTTLAEPRIVDLLSERRADAAQQGRHLSALNAVATGDALGLLATFLELAEAYRGAGRHDFACLLAYRCMEGVVDFGLKRLAGPDFERSAPNYEKLGDPRELEQRFSALSAALGGHSEQTLPRKIGFLQGLLVLCALDEVHARCEPPMAPRSFLQKMRGEADRRNSSVLAHGQRTLGEADSKALLKRAEELAKVVLQEDGFTRLTALRRDLLALRIEELSTPGES